MTPAEKSAQKALDIQGYLIVGGQVLRDIGAVVPAAVLHRRGGTERLESALVVIGTATREEYEAQCSAVYGHRPLLPARPYYYKVIAE